MDMCENQLMNVSKPFSHIERFFQVVHSKNNCGSWCLELKIAVNTLSKWSICLLWLVIDPMMMISLKNPDETLWIFIFMLLSFLLSHFQPITQFYTWVCDHQPLTLLSSPHSALQALSMTEVNGPSSQVAEPQVAIFCGRQTLHMNLQTGQWEPDPQGRQGCYKEASEILSYCQEVGGRPETRHVTRRHNQ